MGDNWESSSEVSSGKDPHQPCPLANLDNFQTSPQFISSRKTKALLS